MAKGKKKDTLYRVVKFEIHLNEGQLAILRKVGDNLWQVWNEALEERQKFFETYIVPIYEELKKAVPAEAVGLRARLKAAYQDHNVTLFDQINALTARRKIGSFCHVPRNWQEETLDTLDGAYKSFLALRRNGDYDARPPRSRGEWEFCEIPGRFGFKIVDGVFRLSCGDIGDGATFDFPIPEYAKGQLARALAVKKFTLYRDERDMRKPGRFWVSLAYELEKPETKPFTPEEAVYVSLGASSIGVVSPKGAEVIELWRSDKHWKPNTDTVNERMKKCKKGSRKWRKRHAARQKMFRLMGAQQKQDRREVVARDLLRHGIHFIVSDLVVRSKKGKLADGSKLERGGALGLNWSAQNTRSIGYLVQWLEEKAKEHGGTVHKHHLPPERVPQGSGRENKIPMALALRDDFLASLQKAR